MNPVREGPGPARVGGFGPVRPRRSAAVRGAPEPLRIRTDGS